MIRPVCPHCAIPLRRRISRGVSQFHCTSCYGFVIDFAAIGRLVPPQTIPSIRKEAKTAPIGTVTCTHCRHKMQVLIPTSGATHVELDFCPRCQLLWLDTGEWHDLEAAHASEVAAGGKDVFQLHARQYADALLAMQEEGRRTQNLYQGGTPVDTPLHKLILAMIGLPVEEESDHFATAPWVTWMIVVVCTVVSWLAFDHMEFALRYLAHRGSDPFPWSLVTAITSFFVHGGVLHWLGNMYFLWVFGDNVEDYLGKGRYLLLLLVATLWGDWMFDLLDPRSSNLPAVGASGGIAGLIAFYLIRFPHRRFVTRFFFTPYAIPGWFLGLVFFFKELMGGFVQMAGSTSVSHLAHLGGALVGVVFAMRCARASDLWS